MQCSGLGAMKDRDQAPTASSQVHRPSAGGPTAGHGFSTTQSRPQSGEPSPETAWRYHHRKSSSLNAPWAQSESNKASLADWKKSAHRQVHQQPSKLRITPYVKQKGPSQPRDAPARNKMIKSLNKRFTPEDLMAVGRPEYVRKKKNPNWKIRLGPSWQRSGLKGNYEYDGGLPSDTKWGNRKRFLFDLVNNLEVWHPRRDSDIRL